MKNSNIPNAMKTDEEIDKIRSLVASYSQQRKIAVFVGAGVSSLSGYPSWTELVLKMADEIEYPVSMIDKNGDMCLSSDEYLKIPQAYYEVKTEDEYNETIENFFCAEKSPNQIHKLLMWLRPRHFITTNYDTLIEQAANAAGLAYSVINSDEKVASAPTSNYILKIHGDFENGNIVLKENDYLNYQTDFRLIDNLMKSIMSTHLVIIIGYSLKDYNIKLILNWVKQVQKETYIVPVFIYTGVDPLSEVEMSYYRGEHLRVMDANVLFDENENPKYIDKYKRSLELLLDHNHTPQWNNSVSDIIDHFHSIFAPVDDVHYLRRTDIVSLFDGAGILYDEILKCEDFSYLLKAYTDYDNLSEEKRSKLDYISLRLHNSGIEGVIELGEGIPNEAICDIKRGCSIDKDIFNASYQEVRERIDRYEDTEEDRYKKAYDLFLLGRYDESMEMYIKLIGDVYKHERWVLYYFSLINLYYIRQTIIQLYEFLSSINGQMFLGRNCRIWEEEEIREMKLSHILTEMPAAIANYSFLSRLTDRNYYTDDFVKMYQDNYEIEKSISKSQYTLAGRSKDQVARIRLFDAINFIYGNRIAFSRFSEHKSFIKIAMREYLRGMISQAQMAAKENDSNRPGIRDYLEFQECLLLIRNFGFDDLRVFFEREQGESLALEAKDLAEFEQYVSDLIDYFDTHLTGELSKEQMIEYLTLRDEMKNTLYLASLYIKNESLIQKCVIYMFENYQSHNCFEYEHNCIIYERFKNRMTSPEEIISHMEKCIKDYIFQCDQGENIVVDFVKNDVMSIAGTLAKWFPGYKSLGIRQCLRNSRNDVREALTPFLKEII